MVQGFEAWECLGIQADEESSQPVSTAKRFLTKTSLHEMYQRISPRSILHGTSLTDSKARGTNTRRAG